MKTLTGHTGYTHCNLYNTAQQISTSFNC